MIDEAGDGNFVVVMLDSHWSRVMTGISEPDVLTIAKREVGQDGAQSGEKSCAGHRLGALGVGIEYIRRAPTRKQ